MATNNDVGTGTPSLETLLVMIKGYEEKNQVQFLAQKEAVMTALAAAEKAVTKAEIAVGERLKLLNEMRGAMDDAAAHYITRREADTREESLQKTINALTERLNEISNRQISNEGQMQGAKALWAIMGGLVAIGITVTGLVLTYGK